MRHFLLFILFVYFLCSSCALPPEEKKTAFSINSPSWIYFNNLRSIYYSTHSDQEQQLDYYTLKKWDQFSAQTTIIPTIVKNWLKEEAYIELAFNGVNSDKIALKLGSRNDLIELPLSKQEHLKLAVNIDSLIRLEEQIKIGDTLSLFSDRYEKTYFLTTMQDYRKLFE